MTLGRARRSPILCLLVALGLAAACADSDAPPQEPVAPEDSVLEGDQGLAPGDGAPSAPVDEELPGSLTDDPFGAPPPSSGFGDEADLGDAGAGELPPTEDYGEAFDAPAADYAAPQVTPTVPGGAPRKGSATPRAGAKKGKGSKQATAANGKKVTRYVDAMLLNVRSRPSTKAPVVRRLLGGAKITVEVQGSFGKIKDGQWVSLKYLSDAPTKKVTRSEVEAAWKKSKHKDTWKPKN